MDSVSTSWSATGHVAVVGLLGEHDLATNATVRRALAATIGSARLTVIDLTACTFLDASTLGVFQRTMRRQQDHGGALLAVNPTGLVARVLALTGFDRVLGCPAGHPPLSAELELDRTRS